MTAVSTPTDRGAGEPQERALLQRVAEGDRDAFRQLYVRYHRRLARFLARLTRGFEEAEDIINDTLWIVWQKAGEFRGESRVSSWIMGIAYRRALKAIQRAATQQRVLLLVGNAAEEGTQGGAESAATRAEIERRLAGLPLEQRLVLELTYYLGHSCDEIAEIMDCPVNTVKTRMFHARRKLRGLFEDPP